ncbi:MAG: PD40 domain-containing protein [Candidatus Krumholzibacteriota bacterium]|nr:PD40 domain-containing protein [Candidatus Krumholzibacteriota bacterium]
MRFKISRGVAYLLLILWVFVLIPAGPGRAQMSRFGKNKVQYKDFNWLILRTPHFDIHFNEGYRDLAARTAVILEYGYQRHARAFDHNLSWRVPVILYGSHTDFQQTNTTWDLIPEGALAFAEPNRRRIVLHFSGSNVDYVQTCIHELVHIFEFDIIYGTLLRSVFSRNMLFQVPLWLMEGMAEYYSIGGVDNGCEMFVRDATIFDYLPYNLNLAGGYFVYKTGQSAIAYINETYGPKKIIEIMDQIKFLRSTEQALRTSIGIDTEELTKEWEKTLRKKYWPLYANKREPEFHGRRLTDHVKNHHYMSTKPEFSPDGEWIVCYSDRDGHEGVYLMKALDGKIEKKLLSGSTSDRFELIRTMKSSLTWSPDGTRIAFVAKSGGRDRLFILGVPSGEVLEEIDLPLDFFFNPCWSPQGDRIAMVGTVRGQTDIYVYDFNRRNIFQVTDDVDDEKEPEWFPDGRKLAYVRFPEITVRARFLPDSTGVERLSGIDFASPGNVLEATSDIWSIDLDRGEKELLISTPGNDESPIIMPDGKEIIFVSDETGISNLYRGSLEVGSYYRFTDVLGGIFTPDYAESRNRLVFAAFNKAGFDLFLMDEFSEKSKTSYSTGSPLMAEQGREEWPSFGRLTPEPEGDDLNASDASASLTPEAGEPSERVVGLDEPEDERPVDFSGRVEGVRRGGVPGAGPGQGRGGGDAHTVSDLVIDEDSKEKIDPDTLQALRDKFRNKIGTIESYDLKFSPDYVGNGMGLFFSTGFGFGLMNQIAFSDLLGDHHVFLSFNLYRSIEESDVMLSYYYLKKRIDYGFGVFQFNNYYYSRMTSIGEAFHDYYYFTERNYGIFGLASYPFSMFSRVDLELQAYTSETRFLHVGYDYDYRVSTGTSPYPESIKRRLIQPSLSLVHDTAYYGMFGPVIGSKFILSYSKALSFSGGDVSRNSVYFDFRKYWPVFYRNSLAFRSIVAVSEGTDHRYFFLGGPTTMRGYDYLQFMGSKLMLFNLEYRYPLLDAIVFGWPGRWGISNIGGTLFFDSGAVWGKGRNIDPLPPGLKPRIINDMEFYSDFGIGFFMRMGFLIFNFQLAWPTDFSYTGNSEFHFYIGPQF